MPSIPIDSCLKIGRLTKLTISFLKKMAQKLAIKIININKNLLLMKETK